jgi:hypothetical protein
MEFMQAVLILEIRRKISTRPDGESRAQASLFGLAFNVEWS